MAFLLGVMLAAPFGQATAEASVVDAQNIEVALTVEAGEAQTVVARIIDPSADEDAVQTVAMATRPDGVFGATVEIRRFDAVVVFEVVETGQQSVPTSLSAMGIDSGVLAMTDAPPADIVIDDEAAGRLWLPLGLFLAALAALAVWFGLGLRDEDVSVTSDGAA